MSLSLLSALLYPPKALASRLLDNARKIFKTPSALAEHLAGTKDKKSPEYKSEIRNVQRWYTSGQQKRIPGKDSLFQLGRLASWKVTAIFTNITDSTTKIIPYLFDLSQQQSARLRGFLINDNKAGAQLYLAYLAGFSKNSARYWEVDIKGVQPA